MQHNSRACDNPPPAILERYYIAIFIIYVVETSGHYLIFCLPCRDRVRAKAKGKEVRIAIRNWKTTNANRRQYTWNVVLNRSTGWERRVEENGIHGFLITNSRKGLKDRVTGPYSRLGTMFCLCAVVTNGKAASGMIDERIISRFGVPLTLQSKDWIIRNRTPDATREYQEFLYLYDKEGDGKDCRTQGV